MKRLIQFACVLTILLGLAATVRADETKGTIKSVDTKGRDIVLKGVVSDTVYELDKNAWVGIDGVKSKLTDLRDGDRVHIVYTKRGDHMMASDVRALRNAQEATGNVRQVFMEKREVTLKGTVKDTTYELNQNATVALNGKKAALADLRPDDYVLVTYTQKGDHNMASDIRATRK